MAIRANTPCEKQQAKRLGEPHLLELQSANCHDIRRVAEGLNWKWRTFWRVTTKDGADCFVKCFFGLGSPERNKKAGRKEAKLVEFFYNTLKNADIVHVPQLHSHWQGNDGEYYIAMDWIDHEGQSLSQWVSSKTGTNKLANFLDCLAEVPPPSWWSSDWILTSLNPDVSGDLNELTRETASKLSAFFYDLADNLGLDKDGRVVFIDYEHLRWESRWLQQVYSAYVLLCGSLRYGILPSLFCSPVRRLLANVPNCEISRNLPLAQKVDRIYAKRTNRGSTLHNGNSWATRLAMDTLAKLALIGSKQ